MRHSNVAAMPAICAVCLCVGSARAVVTTIDATVRSTVVQHLSDGVVNSDTAFESLDESTSNLPLIADARLGSDDSASFTLTASAATTVFSDPRTSETENPSEFGLDVVAFSLDPTTDYEASGMATETRSIVFTAEEIGAENGAELNVTSHFFLDGFMVIWGDLNALIGPTQAELRVRVHQTRPGQESTLVLEALLNLALNDDGTPAVTTGGALTGDNVTLIDTFGAILPLGNAYILALPEISIPYTYEASVGETFTLDADVECRVTNQPYTGAAVALGVPLDRFLDSIGKLVGTSLTPSVVLAKTGGVVPVPLKPLNQGKGTQVSVLTSPQSSLARIMPCGGLGLESAVMPLIFSGLLVFFHRRR